jgi:hypothetical protein
MPVRVVGWSFFNVTFLAALVVPTLVLENFKLAGVSVASAIPVPDSATVCGVPEALSVKVSVSVAAPSCVGVNVTLILHVLFTASVAPQVLLEIAKLVPSAMAMLPIFKVAVPVFFSVTVLAELVLLTVSLPKFSEAGERVTVVAGSTVSVSVVVPVKLPEAPVTVTDAVPVVAVPPAASVSVLVLVAGFGSKAAVTPPGRPEAESDTLPLKPFAGVIVIVLVPCPPCSTLKLPGLANSVKLGCAGPNTYAAP